MIEHFGFSLKILSLKSQDQTLKSFWNRKLISRWCFLKKYSNFMILFFPQRLIHIIGYAICLARQIRLIPRIPKRIGSTISWKHRRLLQRSCTSKTLCRISLLWRQDAVSARFQRFYCLDSRIHSSLSRNQIIGSDCDRHGDVLLLGTFGSLHKVPNPAELRNDSRHLPGDRLARVLCQLQQLVSGCPRSVPNLGLIRWESNSKRLEKTFLIQFVCRRVGLHNVL